MTMFDVGLLPAGRTKTDMAFQIEAASSSEYGDLDWAAATATNKVRRATSCDSPKLLPDAEEGADDSEDDIVFGVISYKWIDVLN